MTELTQERLKELLHYDADTGVFTWAKSNKKRAIAGKTAGNSSHESGYIFIGVLGEVQRAHRLAWLWIYGCMPIGDLDHIDCNKQNNSIKNLRLISRSNNIRNKPKNKGTSSRFVGVCWHKQKDKWMANTKTIEGKNKCLGLFENEVVAALVAEKERRLIAGEFFNESTSVKSILGALND